MYSPAARERLHRLSPQYRNRWSSKPRAMDGKVRAVALKHRRQDYVKELADLKASVKMMERIRP